MQELRLVAVSEDGTYLVLATAGRGTRFTLPVDDRLRAAVRGHFSRLGQFEIEVESPLRPKEIQARIRSGETAEEIAESAGIPVERIRWFEGPVLQEREYMAQQAQRVPVRRPGETAPGPPLGETVEERLGRGGVDLDEAEWDSWKCEDNTWRVRLSFFDNGRPHAAEWGFDPRRRHLSPLDEIAARLTAVEWDEDDSLSDTVTPLVPRRPAMKVVSDGRDLTARGLPGETEHPGDRSPEPLRAAEPREYLADRGRPAPPRPAFAAEPPHLREAAELRASRPGESTPLRRPAARFQEDDEATGLHGARTGTGSDLPDHAAERLAEAPWPVADDPAPADLDDLAGSDDPAGSDDAAGFNDYETPAVAEAVADDDTPHESTASAEAGNATPDEDVRREEAPSADDGVQDAEDHDDAAADGANLEDEPARDETAEEADGAPEAPLDEEAAEPAAETADAAADAARDEVSEREQDAADAAPATVSEAESPGDGEESREDTAATADEPDPETAAAEPEPERAEPEAPAPPPRAPARRPATPAARLREQDEPGTRPVPARDKAADETAPAARPAKPAAAPRPAHREPARPAPKKKPAGRPAMPAAAQDKPAAAAAADTAPAPAAPQRPARGGRRKAKGKRASVPSWDEIMFGARRPE